MNDGVAYHQALNGIRKELRTQLHGHIESKILDSYNALRKPIDLYMEHVVAMANELNGYRQQLVPLLALPLDGNMMRRPELEQVRRQHGIRRGAGFPSVCDETAYCNLQNALRSRCETVSTTIGRTV